MTVTFQKLPQVAVADVCEMLTGEDCASTALHWLPMVHARCTLQPPGLAPARASSHNRIIWFRLVPVFCTELQWIAPDCSDFEELAYAHLTKSE